MQPIFFARQVSYDSCIARMLLPGDTEPDSGRQGSSHVVVRPVREWLVGAGWCSPPRQTDRHGGDMELSQSTPLLVAEKTQTQRQST